MSLVPAGKLVVEAAAGGRAVAAFNIITLEHAEAVVAGAQQAALPVILQLSENAVKFRGGQLLPIARAAAACAEAATVPIGLHLDHVKSTDLLRQAVDAGFSSVMFDAAQLPYAENLEATRSAVDWAHANGLWVEAELGEVGGKDGAAPLDPHAPGARTDPDEARRFVADSGVDALAVAIGSSHAMTSRTASLDHVLLARLAKSVDVPLVLHGSSGLPDTELAAAVAGGIRKVNIGTALNLAMTEAIRTHLTPADPRPYLAAARTAMAATAAAMITALN
ncbi:class II fructose-bisphosphate aldolase [Streptomyces sp. NPDC006430]|uniref:class II fructose-bisphosphate aldolase n=1 Tax=Streptomyces sp. NPDC006430 TaxID=3154299 RepID=UPI0033A61DBB